VVWVCLADARHVAVDAKDVSPVFCYEAKQRSVGGYVRTCDWRFDFRRRDELESQRLVSLLERKAENLRARLIEHLGNNVFGKMIARGDDMGEPMKVAVEVLADMAARDWPTAVPVCGSPSYKLTSYDLDAMLIEVDLLLSWFWPFHKKSEPGDEVKAEFSKIWQSLLADINPNKPVWTLRDYHSPNLLWIPERKGLRRVGIIDTQDCVLGHPAYDLVSMLQDARVDVDFRQADKLYDYYCELRSATGNFNAREFSRAFAILGAQRATKILGIFARLSKRDGKHER